MISTKELREIFDEATRRASSALADVDVKVPTIGRREPPGLAYLAAGLVLGAIVGIVIGSLATPVNGREARQRLTEQVKRVRRVASEAATNGEPAPITGEYASPRTGTYEPA